MKGHIVYVDGPSRGRRLLAVGTISARVDRCDGAAPAVLVDSAGAVLVFESQDEALVAGHCAAYPGQTSRTVHAGHVLARARFQYVTIPEGTPVAWALGPA